MKPLRILFLGFLLLLQACEYEHLERHVKVIEGIGTGYYLYGQRVEVEANPPPVGMQFASWVGDTLGLTGIQDPVLSFFMPNQDIQLEATYEEAPRLVSYRKEVRPIIRRSCSISTCHDENSVVFPLTTYAEVKSKASSISSVIQSGRMPLGTPLPQENIDLIVLWVEQGALNN